MNIKIYFPFYLKKERKLDFIQKTLSKFFKGLIYILLISLKNISIKRNNRFFICGTNFASILLPY